MVRLPAVLRRFTARSRRHRAASFGSRDTLVLKFGRACCVRRIAGAPRPHEEATAALSDQYTFADPAFIASPMTGAMMSKRAEQLGVSTEEAIRTFLDEDRPFMELKRRGEAREVAAVIATTGSTPARWPPSERPARSAPRRRCDDDHGMADYEREHDVETGAQRVYELLSDVTNLPRFFPGITSATPRAGGNAVDTTAVIEPPGQDRREVRGEAWFTTDEQARRLEWGSEGENNYHGSLTVAENGSGATVKLALHTEASHDGIDDAIDDTLGRIDALL